MATARQRINKRLVDGLAADGNDRMIWDLDILGFGVRISPAGRISYVLQYRFEGRQRRYKIGVNGSPWTPETARQEAKRLLGQVADGADPQQYKIDDRAEISVATLCDLYLTEGLITRKLSSIASARSDIEHHIKPILGV
ncbi:Arm DNA-binding domain-containing protein [Sphingomonas sp. GB1N7]|uniref:Arm DNA-binding domain-containing protein n=1 Tax=Parasphingomonas caseinilytica TaxID=3096158 RepID=UPI002FC9523B